MSTSVGFLKPAQSFTIVLPQYNTSGLANWTPGDKISQKFWELKSSLTMKSRCTSGMLPTETALVENDNDSTQAKTNVARVSSLGRMRSSLKKLWKALKQSLKRHWQRRVEPDPVQATNDTSNDITSFEDSVIEQAYPGVTTSTPIVPRHPTVLYPEGINFNETSFISSWDSFKISCCIQATGNDENSIALIDGSFSSRSVTLSFLSWADESSSDISPCQLSFNS